MERTIMIIYRWWHDDSDCITEDEHIRQLEEHAETRIIEMRKHGYTSGDLCLGFDGIFYSGHWEMTTSNTGE